MRGLAGGQMPPEVSAALETDTSDEATTLKTLLAALQTTGAKEAGDDVWQQLLDAFRAWRQTDTGSQIQLPGFQTEYGKHMGQAKAQVKALRPEGRSFQLCR